MDSTNNEFQGKTVSVMPDDALVDVKISGTYYKRLQALFIYLAQKKDVKEFLILYAKMVQGGDPIDEYEWHLHTVLSMIIEIEKVAKENNLLKEEDAEELINKMKEFVNKTSEN